MAILFNGANQAAVDAYFYVLLDWDLDTGVQTWPQSISGMNNAANSY